MSNPIIEELLRCLDYVLDKDRSDEIQIDLQFLGACWGEDDDDGYPAGLMDTEVLVSSVMGTNADLGEEFLFRNEHLEHLRKVLRSGLTEPVLMIIADERGPLPSKEDRSALFVADPVNGL